MTVPDNSVTEDYLFRLTLYLRKRSFNTAQRLLIYANDYIIIVNDLQQFVNTIGYEYSKIET